MKPPTKAAPAEKEEEEIVEIPVTVGTPPPSVADPGSGALLTPLVLGSGSEFWDGNIRIPDHISESIETIFELKIRKFFDADPDQGSGIFSSLDPGWKISFPCSGG
jgi:hypothetical protein